MTDYRPFIEWILPWLLMGLGVWVGGCAVVVAYRIRANRRRAERRDRNA